jgi:hypothetical protein
MFKTINCTKLLKVHFVKIVFIWLFITSCGQVTDKPENLIDSEKMSEILSETLVLESKISRISSSSIDSTRLAYKVKELEILKKFDVDSAMYRSSYQYYIKNPKVLKEIYENAIKKLEKLRDKNNKNG